MVHQYKNNGYNIVLDVNSGAIHIVDDVTFDLIPLFEKELAKEEIISRLDGKYPVQDIEESYEEVKTLAEERQLFTSDEYEDYME